MTLKPYHPAYAAVPLAVVIAFAVLAWLYPIVADIWFFTGGRANDFIGVSGFYQHTYTFGNPRIGEILLYLGAPSRLWRGVYGAAGWVSLLLTGFYCATLRLPRANSLQDMSVIVALAALISLWAPQSGQVIFYLPFNANYVAGFAIMLLFIAVTLSALKRMDLKTGLIAAALGVLAGLSNEHTPPAFFGILVLATASFLFRRELRRAVIGSISSISLLTGFALLFFAPGQSARYPVGKMSALSAPIDVLVARGQTYLWEFTQNASPLLLAIVVLGLWGYSVRSSMSTDRFAASFSVAAAGIVAAFVMCATLIASPEVGARLFFASYCSLAVSVIALIDLVISRESGSQMIVLGTGAVALTAYLGAGWFWISAYNYEFMSNMYSALQQAANGAPISLLEPSKIDFEAGSHFLFRDAYFGSPNPEAARNKHMADYFGVPAVAVPNGTAPD